VVFHQDFPLPASLCHARTRLKAGLTRLQPQRIIRPSTHPTYLKTYNNTYKRQPMTRPAHESDKQFTRREALQGAMAIGGYVATASLPFWSQLALGAEEELVPFTDMPPGYTAPPVAPGAVHYLDSRTISA
jgi:hypothetical protein